ncbi:hypothetical protein BLS_009291 [Venturia inaequalis]|uniref:Uncharacterized protein n=1 Tax=Venturia inaequalis TaxID=5025 RepID=A0A8H3V0X7_VENIN|nr:hypothetical protein BLS_009291 [Venturia inaequalis]KAE9992172.1 hypothetical protein EG327_009906 [Venturia inaequalis]RDI82442.1 hypothetical protein Vi05172_g7485 [Venturia inaequalis]
MPNHRYTQYSSDVDPWEDIDYDDELPYWYELSDYASDDDDGYSSDEDADSFYSEASDEDVNEKPPTRHGRFKGVLSIWGPFN